MNEKSTKHIAIGIVLICLVITVHVLINAFIKGFLPWHRNLDFAATGQFGDFIGGVVGTIINGAAFYFLYLTLNEQRKVTSDQKKDFIKERFESNFFELLKSHQGNVANLKYSKTLYSNVDHFKGQEVFKVLFQEFLECLQDVRRFSNSKLHDDYVKPNYKTTLYTLIQEINPRIDLIEYITIDIAYFIFFNGVDEEGASILRTNFKKKYDDVYYHKLIKYLQLKPKREYTEAFEAWNELYNMSSKERKEITDELYVYRRYIASNELSEKAQSLSANLLQEKYYSGHHFRLGHYFRHLFQSYKYLNSQSDLSDKERYFYGKTLRAQLSTYEQAFIFINSITNFGMKWEYKNEPIILTEDRNVPTSDEISRSKMITFYNLIKNLPGNQLFGMKYKLYYPGVKYELEEQ